MPSRLKAWGFFGHKKINQLAIYTLPSEMIGLYKRNTTNIVENSIRPDKRRYIDPKEGARHYIDIDHYGDSAIHSMPRTWYKASEKYTEDTLLEYGIVPWHVLLLKKHLTEAFEERNFERIILVSTDLGHYLADANVPLHTTENYNGQLSGQKGIHGLWESRLVELNYDNFNLLTGKAVYLEDVRESIWMHILSSHLAVDSVLQMEIVATDKVGEDQKYSFERRGKSEIKVYSRKFCTEYNKLLDGMVERQMRKAIHLIGSIWYTAWVDAGQPSLEYISFANFPLDSISSHQITPVRQHE